jgi:NAD(P)H dehydrogenase (quinone)
MPKVIVIYDSRTGNTEEMAEAVGEGVKEARVDAEVKRVIEARLSDLEGVSGIILGSPTHFGTMSENMKKFISESVAIRGKLEGKIGAAFTSSGSISGGNETTLLSLLLAMLIHGMIVMGDPIKVGGHYGVAALEKPDKEVIEACRGLGERVGKLIARLFS